MYNKITLVGRWVNDPEITVSKNGTEIMRATLAVNDSFNKDHTDFVDVTAFNKTALNTQQYTIKGSKVLVDGKLQQERWEKDGQKRSRHVVIANQIVFLESKNKANTDVSNQSGINTNENRSNDQQGDKNNQREPLDINDSDLPF